MSLSRGGWLGALISVMLIAVLFQRRVVALLLVASGFAIAVALLVQLNLLPTAVAARIIDAMAYFRVFDVTSVEVTPQNWPLVERMASWQAAWRMFEAEPIFGVGPGHFVAAHALYGFKEWPPLGHAHNYYLNVLAEMGSVGLAGYLLALSAWFVGGAVYLRRLGSSPLTGGTGLGRAVVIGVLGALAAAGVHNLFDNLYVHEMNVHVGLLLGIMFAVGRAGEGQLVLEECEVGPDREEVSCHRRER
jgi:O-antigen ligase